MLSALNESCLPLPNNLILRSAVVALVMKLNGVNVELLMLADPITVTESMIAI